MIKTQNPNYRRINTVTHISSSAEAKFHTIIRKNATGEKTRNQEYQEAIYL